MSEKGLGLETLEQSFVSATARECPCGDALPLFGALSKLYIRCHGIFLVCRNGFTGIWPEQLAVLLLAELVEGRCWHALGDAHLTYVLVEMTSPRLRSSGNNEDLFG